MTLYHRAADMLSSVSRDHTPNTRGIEELIAELRAAAQQSALDELTRETERLGLYDEQKPAFAPDVHAIVYEQANDDGLWFRARTAPEAYLQQELRRLHAAIEAGPPVQQAGDVQPVAHELPAMPQAFADYMAKQMPPDTVISDPQWWGGRIWRTAMRLHAAPPAQPRQPLSDDDILDIWSPPVSGLRRPVLGRNKIIAFARAIERAIKGEKS